MRFMKKVHDEEAKGAKARSCLACGLAWLPAVVLLQGAVPILRQETPRLLEEARFQRRGQPALPHKALEQQGTMIFAL
jgi:hypothetical protein